MGHSLPHSLGHSFSRRSAANDSSWLLNAVSWVGEPVLFGFQQNISRCWYFDELWMINADELPFHGGQKNYVVESSSRPGADACSYCSRALRGSYQLLGQLLDSHRNYLLKIIREEIDPRLNRRHGVSDIVQTALLHVLENFQRATEGLFAVSTEEDLRKWLRQICLNALKQEIRDEGRELRDFRNEEPIREGVEQPLCGGPTPSSIVCEEGAGGCA